MARLPALQVVTMAPEGKRGCGTWGWVKGIVERPEGHLKKPRRGGEAAPGDHGHQWPYSLDGDSWGVKEWKRPSDDGEVKGDLKARF
jgi:hypothetical protein